MPKKGFIAVVLPLLGLLLSSCYFTSRTPLPRSPEIDQPLLGFWQAVPKPEDQSKSPSYLLFTENSGVLQVNVLENRFENRELYRGFSSEINGEKYFCLKPVTAKPDTLELDTQPEYYFAHYRINGRQELEISLLNNELFTSAVKAGKLKGDLDEAQRSGFVVLTDTTENIAAFLKSQPREKLLDADSLVRARRVKLPQ